jgi:hypothetical protein
VSVCVLGAPPSGTETSPSFDAHPTLSCALAKDRRIPSSPASSGRFGNVRSMPASFFSESVRYRNCIPAARRPRNEGYRTRAFAADLFLHRVVVARADAEIAGDDLALGFLRQDAGEKGPAFLPLENFLPQRKGLR